MSPLLDRRSHGLRAVCNPLISGTLQQCGKKFLVEADSDNRAGPPPDWGPPRSRTGQPLKAVTSLSFVGPGLDLLVAHATSVKKVLTQDNIVYETRSRSLFLYWNIDSQTARVNETKTPPSDGPPMLLDCSQQQTFVDPQAAICWSANLQPQIKNTFKMGSLIGRGSGESFQLAFHGPGFVVVQPSEGPPVVASS